MFVAPAAQAGGWAATYLDPVPAALEPDRTYTVGYWVLQHGSHAFAGDLGKTGLTFVSDSGDIRSFTGVALPERAHYAVAVSLPAGRWKVVGVQGPFADHEIGVLVLPGGLTLNPRPQTRQFPDEEKVWGEVRPPRDVIAPASVSLPLPEESGFPWWIPAAVLVGAGGFVLAMRGRSREGREG